MNGRGKSDSFIVPMKPSNKGSGASATSPAERVEGRRLPKGNSEEQTRSRAQLRQDLQSALDRVRQVAVNGHFRYFGVPRNGPALTAFRHAVVWLWWRSVQRRTQRHRSKRKLGRRFWLWVERFIPSAQIFHPYPEQRLRVMTRGRSPVR